MGEIEKAGELLEETVVFVPSHLTKGMVAGAFALILGAYAAYEFAHVSKEEVRAMLTGQ